MRAEKERLLLYASLTGLFFLCLSFLISSIPPFIPCVSWFICLPDWWNSHIEFKYLGVSFLAFVLGATLWWPLNNLWPFKRFWNEGKEAERILVLEGGPLEQLLDKAMRRSKTIMVTLKNGKVYVGFVTSSITPGSAQKNIQILPTVSGYREKDKQRVNFTTYYAKAYEDISKDMTSKNADLEDVLEQLKELEKRYKLAEKSGKESKALPKNEALESKTREHLEMVANKLSSEIEMLADSAEDFGVIIPISEIASISIYAAPIHERYFSHNDEESSIS